MVDRSTITQVTQIGVESTPGTLVPATQKLQTLDLEAHIETALEAFRPSGFKYPTIEVLNKEWVTATMKGALSYGELIYILESVLTTDTSHAAVADGTGGQVTGAFKWIFDPSTTAPDTPKTYTFEYGSSARAFKFGNGLFNEWTFHHTRDTVELGGTILGKAITDGITLTPALPSVPLIPATAATFDVFLDPTFGALGTTKLTRLFEGTWTMNGRYGPIWIVDSSQPSYIGVVETVPTVNYTLVVEADSQGMSLLNQLRLSGTAFLRVRSISPNAVYSPQAKTLTAAGGGGNVSAVTPVFTAADVGKAVTEVDVNGNPITTHIPAGVTVSSQSGATGVLSGTLTAGTGINVLVGTAIYNSFTLDAAVKVGAPAAFNDQQGVYAIGYPLEVVHDSGWGKAIHAEVVNGQSTL